MIRHSSRMNWVAALILALVSGEPSARGNDSDCAGNGDSTERISDACDSFQEMDDRGPLNDLVLGDRFSEATGISISGWLAQGFTWNPDSPADRFNGYVSNNDRANEYQLNQLYASLGRDVDQDSGTISLGFRGDVLFGTDTYQFQALGFDDHTVSDGDSRFYKLAFPQLYGEIYLPVGTGVSIIFGKWYALAGFETGLATRDYFYSQTLGYNLTPFTHTGVLLSTSITDQWNLAAGVHRGSDVFEDNNNNLGLAGSIEWSSVDEATSIFFGIVAGPEQDENRDWQDLDDTPGPDSPGENIDRVVYSLSLDRSLSDRLTMILNHDYLFQEGSEAFGIDQAEAYGLAGYLLYELSDTKTMGLRVEVLRDDDGYISSGFRSFNNPAAGVYTNLTAGMTCAISECTVIRPELRWDWQDRDDPSDVPAFDDGTDTSQFLFAFDLVSRF